MIINFRQFALLLTLAVASPLVADDWPMYLYDSAHSSFNKFESKINKQNVSTLDQQWVTNLRAPMAAAPTIVGGVLYVGTWDGTFYALDASSGAPLWSTFVGMAPNPSVPCFQQGIG